MSVRARELSSPERGFLFRVSSSETRRAYARTLRQFAQFVNRDLTTVSTPEIKDWVETQSQAGQKRSTIAQKLSILRSFYDYLQTEGLTTHNPAVAPHINRPKVIDKPSGRRLSHEEVSHLLAGPDRRTPQGARDYAILLCLIRLGLRRSELCDLRVRDLRTGGARPLLLVRPQDRARFIVLPAELLQALTAYLALDAERRRLLHTDGPEAYLFQPLVNNRTNEFARSLYSGTIQRLVRRYGEYAGLGHLRPRDLRFTLVGAALASGIDSLQLKHLTGYRSDRTIRRHASVLKD